MKKRLITLASVVFWLVVWQLGAMALNQPILLVSPISVFKRLTELIFEADFVKSILFSAGRILLGFALGLTIGTALALIAGKVGFIRQLFSPLVSVMKSIPVASFTILALIWLPSRNLSVLVSFLICVPIVYSNMLEGMDALDPELETMAKIFEIPPLRRFTGVYLSQLLPYFRSASKLAIGLCWKSGVAAEVIGIPDGSIGEKLFMSKVYLETEDLFAWTLVIIVLSWICEKLFLLIVNFAVKRVERM
jgi:NitT/TauT family transport system permease protein